MSQLTLDFGPPPPPTLSNFVAGRNRECLAALQALLAQLRAGDSPERRFLYVWGPSGSGKSHLAAALEASRLPQLRVVDDCQRLSPHAQEALFHAFDGMTQAPSAALVCFGDEPPSRLPVMPELASRLSWGMVFCLEPLTDDELQAALEQASRERGLAVGDGVWSYLLRHRRRDLAGLKAILDELDRLSLEHKRPVTLPLLLALLQEQGDRSPAADAR